MGTVQLLIKFSIEALMEAGKDVPALSTGAFCRQCQSNWVEDAVLLDATRLILDTPLLPYNAKQEYSGCSHSYFNPAFVSARLHCNIPILIGDIGNSGDTRSSGGASSQHVS